MEKQITQAEVEALAEQESIKAGETGGFKDIFMKGFIAGFANGMPYGSLKSQGLELSLKLALNLIPSNPEATSKTLLEDASEIYKYLADEYVAEAKPEMKIVELKKDEQKD